MTEAPAPRRGANVVALFGANVVGRALTLLYLMLVARGLGLEGFGQLATVTAYLAVLGVLTDAGLTTLVVRDVARDGSLARHHLAQSVVVRTALSLAVLAALVGALALAGSPAAVRRQFGVGGLSLLPAGLAMAYVAVLMARERMGQVSILATLTGALTLVSAWPALRLGWGVEGLLAMLVLANCVRAGVAARWVGRGGLLPGPPAPLGAAGAWRFFRRAWPYAGFALLSIVYVRAAVILLAALRGVEAAGLYMAAFRLIEAVMLVPLALVNGLFPLMAVQALAGAGGPLGRTYGQAVRVLGLLGLPLAAGATLLAAPVVEAVYGPAYGEAAPVLAVLVWGLALAFLNAPVGNVILGSDRAGRFLPWAALHTAGSAALAGALAWPWGPRGAAWGFVLAELTGFGLQAWFVRPLVGRLPSFPRLLARPALATLLMTVVVEGLRRLAVPPLLLVPVGMAVYGGGLWALGEIRGEDRAALREWLAGIGGAPSVGAAGRGEI